MSSEQEKMDFLESSYNYENNQNCENLSPKCINSNNENLCVVPTETLISDQLNRISISSDTDGGIFDVDDSQLYKPGTFRTPLLKYLNCNTKADVLQVSHLRSFLSGIIDKDEVGVIDSEVISDFTNSQSKCEFSAAKEHDELSYLHVSEKQSLNYKVDEILDQMSSWPNLQEVLNLKPNATDIDSNPASIQLEEFTIHDQVQNSSHIDSLENEKRQNSSPNRHIESPSTISEYSQQNKSDSRTIYFDSPMDVECHSYVDDDKQSENLKNESMKAKDIVNEDLFSNDFLRKILGNAKSIENSDAIAKVSTTPSPSLDFVNKPNIIIDESVFQNLRQIDLFTNKLAEDMNPVPNINEKNSDRTTTILKDSVVPCENVLKRTRDVPFNSSTTCPEVPPKRGKLSENVSISKKRLSLVEYNKKLKSDINLAKQFASESPSDSLPGFPSSEQNMFTPASERENNSLPISSDTSLQNPNYHHMVNTSYLQDPRLARHNSRSLYKDVNSQKQLRSSNIEQIFPSQRVPEASISSVHPPVNQNSSVSTFDIVRNSSNMPSVSELFRPPVNTMKNHQAQHTFSELNSIYPSDFNQRTSDKDRRVFIPSPPSDFNQRTSDKDRRVFIPSPPSESRSYSISPDISDQSMQDVRGRPFLPSFPHLSDDISSPTHHLYSSGSANREAIPNLPPPTSLPRRPLLPTPPIAEQSFTIAPNTSPNSLPHNYQKLAASKNIPYFNQSLQLIEDIGRKLISTDDVYVIIIEMNVEWILGIDKENGVHKISEIGGEFKRVRDNYPDHLAHFNTYFPLLFLDCLNKISTALKGAKEKERAIRNVCKVVRCENVNSYVIFTCDSFVDRSDLDNIPKDGHIILVKFSTKPSGSVKMLGYVRSSATRAYSHKHDHSHEILRFVNTNKRSDLMKIKIKFLIVFGIPGINLDAPIQLIKLTSIKKTLMLNNALRELKASPLCDIILNPRAHNIKNVGLPRRQETSAMTTVVQDIVQTFPSSPQLIIVKSAPFTDSFLAIVQIVEEMQRLKIPGKILVCVRLEVLNQMGLNLVETSSNVVIINREKESIHRRLESRTLDVMVTHTENALDISEEKAKSKVLQEADVLLVVTGSCFYEDVQCMVKDLTYCIVHDAHSFTEPESLLPLLYGVRHLLLFGDPDESCNVSSKCATKLGYNKSLFHRAYNVC